MAKQLAKLLEPLKPMFIEEPLLPTQPEEIADLSRMVSTPIALGERLHTRSDFRPYLERRAIDIAQPDASITNISWLHYRIDHLVSGFTLRRYQRIVQNCVSNRDLRRRLGTPLPHWTYRPCSMHPS